jgi:proline iminopeptidase
VYAETHPERVRFLILRGIFLCREQEMTWFYKEGGASRLFPDYWQAFVEHLSLEERGDIIKSYYQRLTGTDEIARMAAAKAWSIWEGACATLQQNPQVIERFSNPHMALSLARIETHYFINHSFLEPNQIIKNAGRLADIPGVIVHGRYDAICPLDNAFALHEAWPNSELQIIRDAGHAASELGITHALVSATNRIK